MGVLLTKFALDSDNLATLTGSGFEFSFSFSYTGRTAKAKETSLSYDLPIAGEERL